VAFRIHPACFDAARLGQTPQMFFLISCGFFFKGTGLYMPFSYNKKHLSKYYVCKKLLFPLHVVFRSSGCSTNKI